MTSILLQVSEFDRNQRLENNNSSTENTPELSVLTDSEVHPGQAEYDELIAKYLPDANAIQKEVFNIIAPEMENWTVTDRNETLDLLNYPINIIRFLIYNGGDVEQATMKILKTVRWRKDNGVNRVLRERDQIPMYYFEKGMAFFRNRDKMGRPIGVIFARRFQRMQNDTRGFERYVHYVLEAGRKLVKPPVHQISIIVDMTGFSMSQVDWTIGPMFKDLFFDYYPNCVAEFYILNLSWLLTSVWGVIKSMLPADIIEHIHFVSYEELAEFIDPDQLLVEHGGTDTYVYSFQNCPSFNIFEMVDEKTETFADRLVRRRSSNNLSGNSIARRSSISSTSDDNNTNYTNFYDAQESYMSSPRSPVNKLTIPESGEEYQNRQSTYKEFRLRDKEAEDDTFFDSSSTLGSPIKFESQGDIRKMEAILERLRRATDELERLEGDLEQASTTISKSKGKKSAVANPSSKSPTTLKSLILALLTNKTFFMFMTFILSYYLIGLDKKRTIPNPIWLLQSVATFLIEKLHLSNIWNRKKK